MSYKAFDLSGRVALVTGGNSGIGLGSPPPRRSAGREFSPGSTGRGDAGIAIYLMSEASRYPTGDRFVIDGGYTLF